MPLGSGIVQVGHGQLSFGGRSSQKRLHQQARTGGWAGEGYNPQSLPPQWPFLHVRPTTSQVVPPTGDQVSNTQDTPGRVAQI